MKVLHVCASGLSSASGVGLLRCIFRNGQAKKPLRKVLCISTTKDYGVDNAQNSFARGSRVLASASAINKTLVFEALPPSKASIEELLEAGVHFGHRVTKWNPRMAPYIYGERALRTGDTRVHILDVVQTLHYLNETSKFLHTYPSSVARSAEIRGKSIGNVPQGQVKSNLSEKEGVRSSAVPSILFVGTKKQARTSIEQAAYRVNFGQSAAASKELTSDTGIENTIASSFHLMDAVRPRGEASPLYGDAPQKNSSSQYNAHYVNHRWLGGLLTNWTTMKFCIDLLHSFDEKSKTGELEKLPKKEQAIVKKQYQKLERFFGGMKTMQGRPNLVIIVGQDSEMNAVRECKKLQDSQSDVLALSPQSGGQGRRKTLSGGSVYNGLPLRTITLLDTNCDPQLADLFIPANDDSTKSIDYILQKLTDACIGQ